MTSEPSLFDFLEARLDEREQSAKWISDSGEHEFVLADVAAKRRIVALHDESEGEHELRHGHWEGHGSNERWIRDEPNDCPVCHYPGKPDAWFLAEDAPCRTVRLLALPYVGHPDYRPEWAPDAS